MTIPTDKPPVRVLRIISRLNVGGPARHVVILADRLRQHGFETTLVYGHAEPGEGSLEDLTSAKAIQTTRLASLQRRIRPWADLGTIIALYRIARRQRPAVIHTHTSKAGGVGRIAAWLYNRTVSRNDRCLVVHTFHGHVFSGYFSPVGEAAVRAAERILARMTDRIVALSPSQAHDLITVYRIAPAENVEVVPLGLELDGLLALSAPDRTLRRTLGFGDDDFVFGYIGRIAGIKDLPTLVRAFARVVARHPAARLAIIGDGARRPELERLARELGLGEPVGFAGWQRGLPQMYGALDAVVLSSISEGTPVSLIEGMAAGRPVVATRVGGVPDLVEDGTTGFLAPPRDPEALSEAMAAVLRLTPAERAAMGARARARVAAQAGADRLADDMARLYQKKTPGVVLRNT